jgi:aspartate-semialdehyde dehydrogenase
LNLPQKN